MEKKIFLLATILIVGILSIQAAVPVVKYNTKHQINRISQGVHSGELTPIETLQLKQQQHNILRTTKIAKSDGVVTKKERALIKRKKSRANINIYRKKHN